jgi:hypothetical protein
MKKQIGIIFLMLCILTGVAFAQSMGTWTIERTEGGCILTGYGGTDTDIIIPARWGGLTVLEIADGLFEDRNITSVSIPEGVTTIGSFAFANNQISRVTMPSTIVYIGEEAFFGNPLTEIILLEGVENIASSAFPNNQISQITAGIYIYDGINWSRYSNTDEMLEFEFTEEGIGITGYNGYGGSIELPSEIDGFPVVSIGAHVFEGKGLIHVTIPSSITTIGNNAFARNPLDEATLQTIQEKYGEAVLVYQYQF